MISLELLRSLDLLDGTPEAEIEHLLARVADLHLGPHEYAVREGDAPSLVIVLQGTFEITKRLGPLERVIATRTPGDFFGELSLMLGCSSFASLRTARDARALKIDAVDFHSVLRASPALQERIRRKLHDRVDGAFEFSTVAPPAPIIMSGVRYDRETLVIRDFLTRHQVPFDFIDIVDPALPDLMPDAIGQLEHCPLLQVYGGTMLTAPTLRDVARHLRLQIEPYFPKYDLAIVGSGPAALAAAAYAAPEGLRTIVIERATGDAELATERYDDNTGAHSLRGAIEAGAEVLVTRDVIAIHPGADAHEVRLDREELVRARSILLATGVSWRMLSVPGVADLMDAGVYFGNAARTEAMNVQGKTVFLTGDAEPAARAALFLADCAAAVTLIAREPSAPAALGDHLARAVRRKSNLHIECASEVVGVEGKGRLQAVDVANHETGTTMHRASDALFVFAGGEPQTSWLPSEIARNERGYISTGLQMLLTTPELWPLEREPFFLETSVPGIFAAGDVRAGSVKRLAAEIGESSMAVASIHEYLAARPLMARAS